MYGTSLANTIILKSAKPKKLSYRDRFKIPIITLLLARILEY